MQLHQLDVLTRESFHLNYREYFLFVFLFSNDEYLCANCSATCMYTVHGTLFKATNPKPAHATYCWPWWNAHANAHKIHLNCEYIAHCTHEAHCPLNGEKKHLKLRERKRQPNCNSTKTIEMEKLHVQCTSIGSKPVNYDMVDQRLFTILRFCSLPVGMHTMCACAIYVYLSQQQQ